MRQRIKEIFQESIEVKTDTLDKNLDAIIAAVDAMTKALKDDKKIIICGNGGSAADSQHIAAEFVGRFQEERKAFPAISLTTDTSALTAIGNDYGFDVVFSRQMEGLGMFGDVALGLSTSGNSRNVIEAMKVASQKGMKTISLTGHTGGILADLTDISIIVPSKVTARIQESHICVAHCICELVETNLL